MKFLPFFLFLRVIFADQNPKINADPDPKHWFVRLYLYCTCTSFRCSGLGSGRLCNQVPSRISNLTFFSRELGFLLTFHWLKKCSGRCFRFGDPWIRIRKNVRIRTTVSIRYQFIAVCSDWQCCFGCPWAVISKNLFSKFFCSFIFDTKVLHCVRMKERLFIEYC
jgi:hypothetical protein